MLLADQAAPFADGVFDRGAVPPLTFAEAWVGALAYTLQIYFDFSGYTDMAIGLSLMFGVRLPVNFNSPYKSTSIIEFWRRWHMTLSRFLRDYLYIPLGGNRRGPARRYVNLMADDAARGLVARGGMDVRDLGRATRALSDGQPCLERGRRQTAQTRCGGRHVPGGRRRLGVLSSIRFHGGVCDTASDGVWKRARSAVAVGWVARLLRFAGSSFRRSVRQRDLFGASGVAYAGHTACGSLALAQHPGDFSQRAPGDPARRRHPRGASRAAMATDLGVGLRFGPTVRGQLHQARRRLAVSLFQVLRKRRLRSYVLSFALCFLVITGAIAAVNYGIDVNGVYRMQDSDVVRAYVARLRVSPDGLVFVPLEWERKVKIELVRQGTADCYVWGSSHLKLVDKPTAPQVLGDCGTVINLWESGAAFEDFVAAAGTLVASGRHGRFFVGVDPWLLRRNVNSLWTQERSSYERGRAAIGLARDRDGLLGAGAKWLNLLSADYALNNLRAVLMSPRPSQSNEVASLQLRDARDANPNEAIMLPSGRYRPMANAGPPPSLVGDGSFWIAGKALEPGVAAEFEMAIRALEQHNLKVTLVLTPYHPDVMTCRGARVCQTLTTVESYARDLGSRLGVEVVGSYDPRPFGLTGHDFSDDTHVEPAGLSSLRRLTGNPWSVNQRGGARSVDDEQ